MRDGLTPGHRGDIAWPIDASQTIHLGARGPGPGLVVFSTPAMINLMEHAAREALAPFLEPGEESVGVSVEVEHLAPSAPGGTARAEARVTAVDGRLIDFEIVAYDDRERIGSGRHRRAVIRLDKMRARVAEKTAAPTGAPAASPSPDHAASPPALETLRIAIAGPVATITLDRPNRRNAVDTRMTADWERAVAWLGAHPEIRVAIVTGAGPAFCAGDDVRELPSLGLAEARALSLRQARLYLSFESLPQILVAAVNGPAHGAGSVCAVACDFRIASINATFAMPEISLGWAPGYGVAQLTALVGKAQAAELCLLGQAIPARRALEIGLVHQVVPPPMLLPTARKLADRLLATPPVALRETKRLLHLDEGTRPKLAHLADTDAYLRCLDTADAREGIAAFAEKRPPRFTGR